MWWIALPLLIGAVLAAVTWWLSEKAVDDISPGALFQRPPALLPPIVDLNRVHDRLQREADYGRCAWGGGRASHQ